MRLFAGTEGKARLAGLFILGGMAARAVGEAMVRAALVVPGSGRETARNIADYPWLYRAGEAADLVMICAMLVATALLYALFAPVGRHLARVAALISVAGIATLAASGVLAMAPLVLLDGAPHPGISVVESHSLVELALVLRDQVQGVARIFLGLYLLLIGLLAFRSGRLQHALGIGLGLGGLIQMIVRTVALIVPDLANAMVIQADIVSLLAETVFALWLLMLPPRTGTEGESGAMADAFITITSGGLSASINPLGAELWSLTDAHARELMTDADPRWWTGHAPLLFPFVGRSRGDVYRLGGQDYPMPQHGFARRMVFVPIEQTGNAVTFRLEADAGTRAVYPFDFRLDMRFAVEGRTLRMTATVSNRGTRDMPCSFGYHPAFAWPLPYGGAAEDHRVVFEKAEPAPIRKVGHEPGLIALESVTSPVEGAVLAPAHAMFEGDALIWDQLESRSLFWGVPGGEGLKIDFPDTPWLGLWQKPGAHYLCVEPWAGMADPVGFTGDVWEKPGIMRLAPGEKRTFRMDVTVVDV